MGFLDNSSITVDAILTKYGKRKLANGSALNIQYFGLSDDGVDYRLWNAGHTGGSDKYGEAIEEMSMLEATTDTTLNMRYKLGPGEINQIVNPYLILDQTSYTLKYQHKNIGMVDIIPQTGNYKGIETYNFIIMDDSPINYKPAGKQLEGLIGDQAFLPEGEHQNTVIVESAAKLQIWAAPLKNDAYTTIKIEGSSSGVVGTIRITCVANWLSPA